MSIVSLAQEGSSQVTLSTLRDILIKKNIHIADEEDEKAYLLTLQSADAVFHHVQHSTEYIHPALTPVPVVGGRQYWRPNPSENVLNAWSHRANLVASSPSSLLLKGRTIACKDNISIGGLPTTLGLPPEILSKSGGYPISPIDATVVSRILDASGTIIGSAVCECYSACTLSYSPASGPVENPWQMGYTTGGSSSGCGSLVAANFLKGTYGKDFGTTPDMAIGGDQGGSIRLPASYNGIYGLKPTHGLVPYTGIASLVPMLDHTGPMASTLEDIAVLLQVIAGYDGMDPRMSPESPLRRNVKDYPALLHLFKTRLIRDGERLGSGMTIGFLTEGFSMPGLSDQVRDAVYKAKEVFERAGATVTDVSIPMHSEGPSLWTASTRATMADWACAAQTSGYLSYSLPHISPRWPMDQEMFDYLSSKNPAIIAVMLNGALLKDKFGPQAEARAHRKVFELRNAYDEALRQVDVLVTPCAPTVAMPHPKLDSSAMEKIKLAVGTTSNTCPFNITGHPAMSVPCGTLTSEDSTSGIKMPVGMQIIGKHWDEERILNAAAVFKAGQEAQSEGA